MKRLARTVHEHLEKAQASALSAVEIYNKPGISFRTRSYVIFMVIAWTSLLHAIFYRNKTKPWYIDKGSGKGVRYKKVDGVMFAYSMSWAFGRTQAQATLTFTDVIFNSGLEDSLFKMSK